MDDIDFVKFIVEEEAKALFKLKDGLNNTFIDALNYLQNINGRIIVTGLGKSGHVARKVAATLASTGTPAFFIHPVEASHGDLGMIGADDAIVAFSNSGNTAELTDIILYSARENIPLIGITKNADSILGKHSTCVLLLPDVPEVGPLNCAPTTSAIMQMAVGDALAMALMRLKGCSPEEFHRWHPGGSLGKKLLTVSEIMNTGDRVPLISGDTRMPEVLMTITGKGYGTAGIIENDQLIGIITDGDLRRHMDNNLMQKTAAEIMHPDPVVVAPETLAVAAMNIMQSKKISSLFVTIKREVVGYLHLQDCLTAGIK